MTKRMWVPRDLVLEVVTNSDVLSCYKHTPLHAFNYIAMKESETVSDTDSIGRALYDSQVTFIRRPDECSSSQEQLDEPTYAPPLTSSASSSSKEITNYQEEMAFVIGFKGKEEEL
ncbi:hypothetical protein RO3G_11985 [Rhizopus delemar RA 99-880]|uniref:Uncharacterized protein n=1 Tax=Rhizopus delemar (strain RA 99-880 / ATCC MYA-4621 / FGSC 9543 / NRRL 43880) TaxID=246409 RepID=I1CFP4_RHIO9|nr:hypothetical protein RO3G_11985 [Rhizopus delemar RA 99-880]|eukprot:EIE87274.1 hypothetical protein RO3G_11985 [Rhizopus delemar RA 99-880]